MTTAQIWGPMRKMRTVGAVRAVAGLIALGLALAGCHSRPAAGAPSTGSSATGAPSTDPGAPPSSSVDSTATPGPTTAPPKASTAARPGTGTTGTGTTGSGGTGSGAAPAAPSGHVDLTDPHKKDIAMQLVSSAENSSLNWRGQFAYIEDIGDGRGYTGGIIGFCSGTGDMLEVVQAYANAKPGNILASYLPALKKVNNSDSHAGLDPNFPRDWRTAATDPVFQAAQENERDRVYFNPAVQQAKQDGLYALGQFIYYDAIVMHGPGNDGSSFGGIRKAAMARAKTPAQGGDQVTYLNAFLDARKAAMLTEEAHSDTSRVDTEQRLFVKAGNLDLVPPLSWKTYGDPYTISS
jgi:chitosanase